MSDRCDVVVLYYTEELERFKRLEKDFPSNKRIKSKVELYSKAVKDMKGRYPEYFV